jgi:RNA polymerase sigma factor (sigma-70 family)
MRRFLSYLIRGPPFPLSSETSEKGGNDMAKDRYININGEKVPVSEEVYSAFKRPAWVERKRRAVRADRERSMDAFMEDGLELPDDRALVAEIVEDKLLLDMLFAALAELTEDERGLIDALFYEDKSERQIAAETGRSKTSVHKQKARILDKLKKMLGEL